ncbi:MAG: flavin reductase [Planctomycetaceae bacterium]|jgi:flavin reductase (DIM6/NTAB) family NADH-FMN oxidoreductase RutF|nr:flavin reductase [Planctomycetaceae bacterium]
MTSDSHQPEGLVQLQVEHPIWDRFFTVAPLVVIGTREANGENDLAPKHMAAPMGWDNYFGFVCTPSHSTYQNISREGVFAVSYPTVDSVLMAALAASPRCDDDSKPALMALPSFRTEEVDCPCLSESSVFLECRLDRIVDNFGVNSLIVGKIVAAQIRSSALRREDIDDEDTVTASPLLAYVSPGRFATIDKSVAFPFPAGFRRGEDSPNES